MIEAQGISSNRIVATRFAKMRAGLNGKEVVLTRNKTLRFVTHAIACNHFLANLQFLFFGGRTALTITITIDHMFIVSR